MGWGWGQSAEGHEAAAFHCKFFYSCGLVPPHTYYFSGFFFKAKNKVRREKGKHGGNIKLSEEFVLNTHTTLVLTFVTAGPHICLRAV